MENNNSEYQSALDFIYQHVNLGITRNLTFSKERFNLDRMFSFMDLLENPQNKYPCIHVAGTKGKGSTCAMLANVLIKAGYKTGFYSSPHINSFNERIQINWEYIPNHKLVNITEILKEAEKKIQDISTFELITALSFIYFLQEKVDVAVIEVGLGGRFDATNVLNPDLSIITNISLDHMKILGETIEEIAFEKCGIIKHGKPVLSSRQVKSVEEIIKNNAANMQSQVTFADRVYKSECLSYDLINQRVLFTNLMNKTTIEINLPLLGDHQMENAQTVIASLEILKKQGWTISENSITEGFSKVKWPGRFEILSHKPLIIIDGAHNRYSFENLRETIQKYLPSRPITLVFGASEDKQIEEMLKVIAPICKQIIFTKANHPRAASQKILEKYGKSLGIRYQKSESIEDSILKGISCLGEEGALIAAGSLFIAGAVRSEINENQEIISLIHES